MQLTLRQEIKIMSAELETLTREVQEAKDTMTQAATIIQEEAAKITDLAAQLVAAAGEPAKLQELADGLDASANALAAAFPPAE
jgi:chromosome segregation ATPase